MRCFRTPPAIADVEMDADVTCTVWPTSTECLFVSEERNTQADAGLAIDCAVLQNAPEGETLNGKSSFWAASQ